MRDEELVTRYLQGETEAFDTLAARYQERIYRLAYRMLGNRDDALDAVQEVFLRLLRSLSGFQGHARFGTWLYRLAANACIDYHRRQSSTLAMPVGVDLQVAAPAEEPHTQCEKEFRQYLLDQALKQLPEAQRLLVVLRDREGLPYEEIAEILGIEVGTLKSRLHRARGALRRVLENDVTVVGQEQAGPARVLPTGELA